MEQKKAKMTRNVLGLMALQWSQKPVPGLMELFRSLWGKKLVCYLDRDGSVTCAGWELNDVTSVFSLVNNPVHEKYVCARCGEESVLKMMQDKGHHGYQGQEAAALLEQTFPHLFSNADAKDDVADGSEASTVSSEEGE